MKNETFQIGSQIIRIVGYTEELPPSNQLIEKFATSNINEADLTVYIHCQPAAYTSADYEKFPLLYRDKYGMCIYSDGIKYHYVFVRDGVNYISSAHYDASLRMAQIYVIPQNVPNNYIHLLYTTPFQLIYMQHLAFYSDSYLVHTSSTVFNESVGICLCGESGAGKTTISSLLLQKPQFRVLTDETTLLELKGDKIVISGTPWKGSDSMFARNESVVLKRIYFISHAKKKNYAEKIGRDASANRLLQQSFPYYWDKQAMLNIFRKILRTVKQVECYSFAFIPDESAIQYIEKHLAEE